MIYCAKCGVRLPDEAAFCPACGAQVVRPEAAGQQNYGYGQPYVNYNDPAADASANKVYGIIAYIGILVLITIFFAPKESKYSRYHANQGLVLLIAGAIFSTGLSIIGAIFGGIAAGAAFWTAPLTTAIFGILTGISGIILSAAGIFWLVLAVMGIINAANGELKPLPVIGKYTILK
jgi:uncharacterized membrane protein/predicted RNA-binding Zn-ribbon protein involved in translation (DUF1610 family)